MIINGYDILIETGRWVDVDRLYSVAFYDRFIHEITRLTENPESPIYRQASPLNKIKRLRMTNERVYARTNHISMRICILAVVGRGEVKRDERSGALDFDFMAYLLAHEDYRPDRFIPLKSKEEHFAPKPKEDKEEVVVTAAPLPPIRWAPYITSTALSEDQAFALLFPPKEKKVAPRKSTTDYFTLIMDQITRSDHSDRILVDLPPGSDQWERSQIKTLQTNISFRLKSHNQRYSVRFDDISRKLVLVTPNKIATYCYRHIYHRKRQALEADHV